MLKDMFNMSLYVIRSKYHSRLYKNDIVRKKFLLGLR